MAAGTDGTKPQAFRSRQAAAVAGISVRQVSRWDEIGFVAPSVKHAKGSGTRRIYSESDLVLLTAIKTLLDAGVGFAAVRKAVDKKRKQICDFACDKPIVWERGAATIALDIADVRVRTRKQIARQQQIARKTEQEKRDRRNARRRERYATDTEYRKRVSTQTADYQRRRYHTDPEFRQRQKDMSKRSRQRRREAEKADEGNAR